MKVFATVLVIALIAIININLSASQKSTKKATGLVIGLIFSNKYIDIFYIFTFIAINFKTT